MWRWSQIVSAMNGDRHCYRPISGMDLNPTRQTENDPIREQPAGLSAPPPGGGRPAAEKKGPELEHSSANAGGADRRRPQSQNKWVRSNLKSVKIKSGASAHGRCTNAAGFSLKASRKRKQERTIQTGRAVQYIASGKTAFAAASLPVMISIDARRRNSSADFKNARPSPGAKAERVNVHDFL